MPPQVGAATGLVSGGIGLGVGAALSGVTGAIGVASCGTKLLVGGIHAAAQAAGGAVSSMAGTVIDNLAHQRTWHEGLGQAATAGAVTGFVSGSISGFSACREAANKAAEASNAAKTSVEQIGSRAAEVAPTKALCKVTRNISVNFVVNPARFCFIWGTNYHVGLLRPNMATQTKHTQVHVNRVQKSKTFEAATLVEVAAESI